MGEQEPNAPRATCLGGGHPILSVLSGCPECGGLPVDRRDRRAVAIHGRMVFASNFFCGLLVLASTTSFRIGEPGSSTLSVTVPGVGTSAAMSLVDLAIIQEAFIVTQYRSLKLRGRAGWRVPPPPRHPDPTLRDLRSKGTKSASSDLWPRSERWWPFTGSPRLDGPA